MIKLGPIVIYTGGYLNGWRMVGIGWRVTWFFGFSVNEKLLRYSYDD